MGNLEDSDERIMVNATNLYLMCINMVTHYLSMMCINMCINMICICVYINMHMCV